MILLRPAKSVFPVQYSRARLSRYTMSASCCGGRAFFNTRSGAVCWSRSHLDLNDPIVRGSGLAVPFDHDEITGVRSEYLFAVSHSETLDLTVQTTLDCSCRCSYCYQGNDKPANCFAGAREQAFLLEWITPKLDSYKRLFINWFGGEPLLNSSMILKLSPELIRNCAKHACDYSSGIVTNGILLSKDLIRKLISDAWVCSFSLTLDGPGEIHNRRRIRKNGNGTFDEICNAIDNLLEFPDAHITLRIQVDRENLNFMSELMSFLQQKRWFSSPNIKIVFVRTKKRTANCNFPRESVISQELWGSVEEQLFRLCREYQIPLKPNLPSLPPGGCQNRHFYAFNPRGDIFPCHALLSAEPMPAEQLARWRAWLPWKNHSECAECSLFPICQGGCPFNTLNASQVPVTELPCPDWRFSLEWKLCLWTESKLKDEHRK